MRRRREGRKRNGANGDSEKGWKGVNVEKGEEKRTLNNRPRRITPLSKTRQELVEHDSAPQFLVEQVAFVQEEDDHDLFHTTHRHTSVSTTLLSS